MSFLRLSFLEPKSVASTIKQQCLASIVCGTWIALGPIAVEEHYAGRLALFESKLNSSYGHKLLNINVV